MKILGIGESVIDNMYLTERKTVPGKRTPDEIHVGGPVLISMILLARLKQQCTFLTTLGYDKGAGKVKKTLFREKIQLYPAYQAKTKENNILVSPSTGRRIKLRGKKSIQAANTLEPLVIKQFDLIIIDRHNKQAFYEVVKHKKQSAKIIIDPSTEISSYTLDMIRFADYPIIPIEALTKISGTDLVSSLKHMYEVSKKPLVVTAGELGTILFDGHAMKLIPALKVTSVDTTGAGDIYRGAFAYGITQGWEMTACIEYANCVAAMHCTRRGNAAAVPTKEEIELCRKLCLTKKSVTRPTINTYFDRLYRM